MPNFLAEEEFVSLRKLHKTIKDKKVAGRIKAIVMLHLGFTPYPDVSISDD